MVSREPKNKTEISIHALREEGDTKLVEPLDHPEKFLSTPSARRATSPSPVMVCHTKISIHALREEGDRLTASVLYRVSPFLSTPSARRATTAPAKIMPNGYISIHALREEGDPQIR